MVCMEFETKYFADQGELKFTGIVSVRSILLLFGISFLKSHRDMKHDVKVFAHFWYGCEYPDYFSIFFQ